MFRLLISGALNSLSASFRTNKKSCERLIHLHYERGSSGKFFFFPRYSGGPFMKKTLITLTLLSSFGAFAQARLDTTTVQPSVPAKPDVFLPSATITQGFDSLPAAITAGWSTVNNSAPANTTLPDGAGWIQGQGTQLVPLAGQAGGANSFAMFTFNSIAAGQAGTNSSWLISPVVNFGTGATLDFWTIKRGAPFPDRMEVRFSTAGPSTNVGTAVTSVGDFSNLAFTVSPATPLVTTDFVCPATGVAAPQSATANIPSFPVAAWCRITLTGFPVGGSGRIAFRHATPDGGPNGANGTVGGIDTFSFDEGTAAPVIARVPTPALNGLSMLAMFGLLAGLGAFAARRYS
jgi:hypothetical protein